ncbi:MAG: type I DNA topoisomerase [Deltaproteobacteria bacterium]|jgi:DNA topoisomerase-1|nr:type I DNA topoisomerase [Deltaproteobacteria bacterium]
MVQSKSESKSGIKLVIVESPTKAKTIRKFLGKDYIVESCMGHIRDLPQSSKDIPEKFKKEKWAQLGVNVDKNFEPLYCVPKDKIKVVKNLKDKLAEANELFLATDEDREGESISWHLVEVLNPKVPTKRMVFNEITKEAIQKSLKETRKIDFNLVKAQEARRVLDRLVGYTISPLLWKKVAYGLSAGRVQSVAVRLIVEKELDRIKFKKSEYWGVRAELEKNGISFESKLAEYKNQKVAIGKDFDGLTGKLIENKNVIVIDEAKAKEITIQSKNLPWIVNEIEEKPVLRKPSAPFITSTLQQEANRKLGLSSRETMQVAQKLYEQGFITYMRTDSPFLSQEAILAARDCILKKYGKEYLPEGPRVYDAKKSKGAQEAHEAIRPAGSQFVDPEASELTGSQFKLYELIWMRTMASQMVDCRQKQVSSKIKAGEALFSASGMTIDFPGFLRAYVEGSDDPEAELLEREVRLPKLLKGDNLKLLQAEVTFHETKPPARFTEASLVQTMEKEGIGRPSTYASVIGTIIDRGYVKKMLNALYPTFTAMVVSKLLKNYFPEYVDLGFTSGMEASLDNIAGGDLDREQYLKEVYFGNKGLKHQVEDQSEKIDPTEARTIKLEGMDKFTFHVGRYGAYLSTKRDGEEFSASLPESESPADITPEMAEKLIDQKINGADSLGKDPVTGLPIYVLSGRFGPYVQLGNITEENDKPKRASLPPNVLPENVTLQVATSLLSLPINLGPHPETGKDIKVGLGRFGPYVVHDGDFRSIPKGTDMFQVDMKQALELVNAPKKGRGANKTPVKSLGIHPVTNEEVQIFNGPYGPYFKVGKVNGSLPENVEIEKATLEMAIEVLKDKVKPPKVVKPKKASKAEKSLKENKEINGSKGAKVSKESKVIKESKVSKKELPAKKIIIRKKK